MLQSGPGFERGMIAPSSLCRFVRFSAGRITIGAMAHAEASTGYTGATDAIRAVLKSQYRAALAMLRQAIELCPAETWASREYTNPFWRVAYHTLYFTHLYLQRDENSFRPWEHHQTGIHDMDDRPAPPDILALTEHPHRPPRTGEPYTKAQVLAYWDLCDEMVDSAVDAIDLSAPTSGFSWYKVSKLDHQMINLRHVQHHAGQLADRVRAEAGLGVPWVSARRKSP